MGLLLSCQQCIASKEIRTDDQKVPYPRSTNVAWRGRGSTAEVEWTPVDRSGNCLCCYKPTIQWASLFVRTGLVTSLWFKISKARYERSHDLPYRLTEAVTVYMDRTWSVSANDAQNAIGYSQRIRKLLCHLDLFVAIVQCTPGVAVTWPYLAVRYVAACSYQSWWLVATWLCRVVTSTVVISARVNWSVVKHTHIWEQESLTLQF